MTDSGPALNWQRTSPIAVIFFLLRAARSFITNGLPALVVITATVASLSDSKKALLFTGLAALAVTAAIFAVLAWLRFRFCINTDRVLLRSGVIHREELTVEFNRIQNVSIREPFYMRPFGLSLLTIDTAGSQAKEIILAGIKKQAAIEWRDTILSSARPTPANSDSENADASRDPSLLLSRTPKDIVIYGLTINFFLWVLIAAGAFFGAFDSADKLLSWTVDNLRLQSVLSLAQNDLATVEKVVIVALLVLLTLLLLPAISVIGALFRYYGYRLTAEGETYRRNSGFLSRHDESVKQHKIQAMVLKQNFVGRLFKRTNLQLRVASAGSGMESGQLPTGPRSTFLVPALHAHEIEGLGEEFFPGCDTSTANYSRIDRRRLKTVVLGYTVLPTTLLTSVVLSLLIDWKLALVLPLSMALGWVLTDRIWQRIGYAVVGEFGFIRHGFIGTRVTVFPLFKVQRVDITQTPGLRRKALANLNIHLASHSLNIPYMKFDDAKALRDLALYHAETSNRPWY